MIKASICLTDQILKQYDDNFDVFNIKYNNKDYIFKFNKSKSKLYTPDAFSRTVEDYIYNEVLTSVLARICDIKCVKPVISKINGNFGILENNIFEKNFNSLTGYDIVLEYLHYLKKNNKIDSSLINDERQFVINKMNNFNTIIDALYYFFGEYDDIENLVEDFVKRFAFDCLMMQTDRGLGNWIVLYNDDNVKFANMFDNEECFFTNKRMEMTYDGSEKSNSQILTNFFKNADAKYVQIFIDLFQSLNLRNFNMGLIRFEIENGNIPDDYKSRVISAFYTNYCKIDKIIKNSKYNIQIK